MRRPRRGIFCASKARGFGSSGHSLLLFPLALLSSVSGAQRTGFPMTTSVDRRSVNAGNADSREEARRAPAGGFRFGGSPLEQPPYLSELAHTRKFRAERFFSWTAPPPVLFLTLQKENGGWKCHVPSNVLIQNLSMFHMKHPTAQHRREPVILAAGDKNLLVF